MKTTFAAAAALLSFSASAAAQYTQSREFFLVAHSKDAKVNNTVFSACHEGAAIEGLCVGSTTRNASSGYQTYQFNTTQNTQVSTGLLTFELRGGNFNESEPMTLYRDPSTNVALPLFEPTSGGQFVGFDENNRMYISSALDDTVDPPTFTSNRKLYRWYTCKANFEGYVYNTLNWVDGKAAPQNPTCEKVSVVREFVNDP